MNYEYKKTEKVMEMLSKDMSSKNVRYAVSILPNEIKKMNKELNMCENLMKNTADLFGENDPYLKELRVRHADVVFWKKSAEGLLESLKKTLITVQNKAQEIANNLDK